MKKFKITKKALSYIILIFSLLIFLLIYGFIIGGEISPFLWGGMFLFLVIIVTAISKNYNKYKNRFIKLDFLNVFIISFILLIGAHTFYYNFNNISYTTVRTYGTVVNEITYKGGGTAWFYNPEGKELSAEVKDYRMIVYDETTLLYKGDTIIIEERKGVFDVIYQVIKNNK